MIGMNRQWKKLHTQEGFTIVELIVALALFAIFVSGAAILIVGAYTSTRRGEALTQAALSSQQVFEAVNSIAGYKFNELQAGNYTLDDSTGTWELAPSTGNDDVVVTIEDVARDGSSDITGTGTNDPHTRFIHAIVNYDIREGASRSTSASQYITDWGASTYTETTATQFASGTSNGLEITSDDDGELRVEQGRMEVGLVEGVGSTTTTVTLENEYNDPVVVAVHLQQNNTASVTTRVSNVTSTSFDVRLQEATLGASAITTDDVYYMVVESGTWTFGDDDTQIAAGTIDTDIVQSGLGGGWSNGELVEFTTAFNTRPVVLHQVMTENSTDWITTMVSSVSGSANPPTATAFEVSLHGAQVTSTHQSGGSDVAETVGWIAIEGGVTSTADGVPFEAIVTPDEVSHTGKTYNYRHGTLADPHVLVSKLEEDGGDGAFHMLDAVSTTQVTMHSEEDTAFDAEQVHTGETFGYFASSEAFSTYLADATFPAPTMEVGTAQIHGVTDVIMEAGIVTGVTGSVWTTVNFTNTDFTDPIVVGIQSELNNTAPVSLRISNVTSTSFDVMLQSPDGSTPAAENIRYMAVERGTWYVRGIKIEANSTMSSTVASSPFIGGSWTGTIHPYTHTYTADPVILHSVMSANDPSWISSVVFAPAGRTFAPGRTAMQIAMNGAEVTTTHGAAEELGWIIIEQGAQFEINGVNVETARVAGIQGHDDGCYTSTYATINSSNAFAVASQNKMQGNDGGWLVECSSDSTSVGMHIDEDQVVDVERHHPAETISYVAFSDTLSIDAADSGSWTTVNLQQTYTAPVVMITGYENSTTESFSARLRSVASNSFEVSLQEPNNDYIGGESVHYMVIEQGTWQMGSTKIEASSAQVSTVGSAPTVGGTWVAENKSYTHEYDSNPIVLHQVQTFEDSDWITSWVSRQGNRIHPPDRNGFQIAMNGAEVTSMHEPETIGWVVIQNTGSDSYDGVDFITGIADPGMLGHDNGCTTQSYGTTFTNPVVSTSQMEMDGADGSWLQMCDYSTTDFGAHAEEDQVLNPERSHSSEIFGYIVFDQPFDVSGDADGGTYTSPVFGPIANAHILEWTENQNGCADCNIRLQVRTAENAADIASATWYGPTGAGSFFEEPTGQLLHTDHIGDAYIQYRAVFTSSDGQTQILEDVTISYIP